MWEDRKKQELEEAAIAVPATVLRKESHHNIINYRNHVKMKGELF